MTTSSEWESERKLHRAEVAELKMEIANLTADNEILREKVQDLDRWIIDLLRAQAE